MWNVNHTFKDFDRFFVGFDPLVKKISEAAEQATKLAQEAKYPPYNIKKVDENRYVIEMAVAGFGKQDIELELAGDKLVVKGNAQQGDEATPDGFYPTYLHHGLAHRPFTRTWTLADNVEVAGATMINGILKIALEAIIPEENKPKKIEISDTEQDQESASSDAQLLTEEKGKK